MDTLELKSEERTKKHSPSRKRKKNISELNLKELDITVKSLPFMMKKFKRCVIMFNQEAHTVAERQS